MTSPKYKVTWKTFLLPVIGLIAFFAYLYIFNVDIQQIIAQVQQVNLSSYVIAAVISVLDVLLFATAWHMLLRFLAVKISLLKSTMFVWIGIFVDTLIPAESLSGEITKIFLVNQENEGSAGKATAAIVAHRLIGMGLNLASLLIGAVLLLYERLLYGIVLYLILILVVSICIFLGLIVLLCFREKWTFKMVDAVIRFAEWISRGRWKLAKFREEVTEIHQAFHNAIKEYVHAPRTLVAASFFSVFSWMLSLAVYYFTFLAIGYSQINWSAILVTYSVFVAVKSLPVGIPFEVGLPEITLTTLFVFFDVPGLISATVTILTRLLTLWLRFFIGFAAQQWIGIKAIVSRFNGEGIQT